MIRELEEHFLSWEQVLLENIFSKFIAPSWVLACSDGRMLCLFCNLDLLSVSFASCLLAFGTLFTTPIKTLYVTFNTT